ncbi:MAG: class I SAM-dependent methyltransferase [Solirubrobacteraceae bacterium]|jgi:SAM-dependent methyltransferase
MWLASRASKGRAVDLGCGDGRNSLYLLHNAWLVDAVDLSRPGLAKLEGLANAAGLAQGLELVCSDALHFTSQLRTEYDLVRASTILDHVIPSDVLPLARDIVRIIRPGGWLYVSVFLQGDAALSAPQVARSPTAFGIINPFAPNALLRMFRSLQAVRYEERQEEDRSHGPWHVHQIARLAARKAQR